MKKTMLYCCYIVSFALSITMLSCKRESVPSLSDFGNGVPENVQLLTYGGGTITFSWTRIEKAASYTVQLLTALDSDTPVDQYTTVSGDSYSFTGLDDITGYYVRVRANFNTPQKPVLGDWVYVLDGQQPGRIMPKYGFVAADFEEPEPEPTIELQLYPNFPEGWEDETMPHLTAFDPNGVDEFPSGKWQTSWARPNGGSTIARQADGKYGMLTQNDHDAIIGMNFDLPYGASKLSFYIAPATKNDNNMGDLTVEYSVDAGNSWTELARYTLSDGIPWKRDMDDPLNYKEFELDIKVPVRFRFTQHSEGVGSSSRWTIDEIAVYY